jgi:hypothetical protein
MTTQRNPREHTPPASEMAHTMACQPAELRRIPANWEPIQTAPHVSAAGASSLSAPTPADGKHGAFFLNVAKTCASLS